MSDHDVDIHIRGTGGKQAADELGLVTDASGRADDALSGFGSRGMKSLDGFLGRLKDAGGEFDNLRGKIDSMNGVALKMGAAGGGALLVANQWSKAAYEADNVDARLTSILTQQGRLADKDTIMNVVQRVRTEGHFAEDEPLTETAVHLASFSVKTGDLTKLEEFALRQSRTMGKQGVDMAPDAVADQLGKAYNDINLDSMKRAGLAFTEQDQKALKAAKSIGEAAGRMEWMRIVEESVQKNTVALGDSLSDAQKNANDFTYQWGEMQEELGRGVNDAKGGVLGFLGGVVGKMNEIDAAHPGFIRAIGEITAIGGGGLVAGAGALLIGSAMAKGALNIMQFKQALKGSAEAADLAAGAKKNLLKNTLDDLNAEKAKTGVALDEAAALTKSGAAAEEAAEKTGLLAKAKGLLGSSVGNLSKLEAFGGGEAVTVGGAALAAGLGAGAGLGATRDYEALGHSAMESEMAGIATGIGAAAVAMFVPGGAIAVGLAEGVRLLMNKTINGPAEAAAELGDGLSDKEITGQKGMTHQQKADNDYALAARKKQEADGMDNTWDWLGSGRRKQEQMWREASGLRMAGDTESRAAGAQTKQHDDLIGKGRIVAPALDMSIFSGSGAGNVANSGGTRTATRTSVQTHHSDDVTVVVTRKQSKTERDRQQYVSRRRPG